MKNRLQEKVKNIDFNFLAKVTYIFFVILIFIITVCILIEAPIQHHFKNIGKNDVWFGDGWQYADTGESVISYSQHYLRIYTKDGYAAITKTLDFTPASEEYLCFRVRALDTIVYVNGEEWYTRNFIDKYRSYSRKMYLLHQVPVDGLKAGDKITIEMHTAAGGEQMMLQFPAMGDRYALVLYILRQSRNSIGICGIAIIILLFGLVVSHSAIFADSRQDVNSLNWLTIFLVMSVVYISTECGCMDILVERISIITWFNNISMIMLPVPFILFIKYAFFPGHCRYDILAFINCLIGIISVAAFILYAMSMSDFYNFVHLLIVIDIIACITSFIQEKSMPALEVLIGFGAIFISVLASIMFYWNERVYPCSIVFGYGLLIFSVCMLLWIVRSRFDLKRMRAEADHVIMERDKIAAEAASEQKSRFLSSMSHEIRTPLNAILGLNELIMHESTDINIKKYSVDIQSAGRTLLALINDILDFSKIETGKMDIVASDYSLSSVLNDIVVMVRERISDRKLELRLDIDAELPDLLYGDEVRIKQIVINLMTNAVKYTKEGWVELSVKRQSASEYLDDENIRLDICVSDTGMGIKEEDLSRLFIEFERLDRLKNRSIEGSGLGLSITSRLVNLMNGKISVESEYGKGSSFRVIIPQKIVSDTPIGDYKQRFEILSNEKSEEPLETMSFPGKRVFVVDDNEMNLEVIASILEMLDIQVDRAGSGQEAIECLDREVYDLILTDDMMPEISGTELMQYLHSHEGSVSHDTPIVVLTANAVAGVREEYIRKGFDDYMTKPIDIDVLQKILMKYLK